MLRHFRALRSAAWALPLLLVGLLAFAGCSAPGGIGAKPTATPYAATILQRAQSAQYNDAKFTMNMTTTTAGTSLTFTGDGKITKSPDRIEITMSTSISGQSITFDIIGDTASNTGYFKLSGITLPGVNSSTWYKSSGGSSAASALSPISASTFSQLSQLSNAKLLGTEQLGGTSVWHLQGTSTVSGTATTVDMYVRQDNYRPQRIVAQSTGTTPLNMTINFTGYNTGLTIPLPPASQVQTLPS